MAEEAAGRPEDDAEELRILDAAEFLAHRSRPLFPTTGEEPRT